MWRTAQSVSNRVYKSMSHVVFCVVPSSEVPNVRCIWDRWILCQRGRGSKGNPYTWWKTGPKWWIIMNLFFRVARLSLPSRPPHLITATMPERTNERCTLHYPFQNMSPSRSDMTIFLRTLKCALTFPLSICRFINVLVCDVCFCWRLMKVMKFRLRK